MAGDSFQVVVLGAGPGGYAAAFYAADLGMQVALVDEEKNPGGVCLYRGCIPSKALLHVAKVMDEARHAEHWGVTFGKPTIDVDKLRSYKNRASWTSSHPASAASRGCGRSSSSRGAPRSPGRGR